MAYPDEILADSPVAYWRMHDTSGLIQDSSGNGNHATESDTGGIAYQAAGPLTGQTSYSIEVNDAWFTGPDHNSLDVGDVFTIECWFKQSDPLAYDQLRVIFSKRNGGPSLAIEAGDGIMLGKADINFVYVSDDNFADITTWWHVAWTKNGTTRQFYVNGQPATSTVANELTMVNSTGLWWIGNEADVNPFFGWLSEIAFYNTALSSARIAAHYAAANMSPLTTPYALFPAKIY